MNEIKNREDVYILVSTFYKNIRNDELLGPIFNQQIENWGEHLDKLTDFWVTALLGIPCFKGNPSRAHANVDKNFNHSITPDHFNRWISLWSDTIDSLFHGQLAEQAKEAAKRMAMIQYSVIENHRND